MTVGMHAVNLANKWLDMLGGTAFTAPANTYAKLHIGDPGAAGASNPSANTTRVILAWGSANGSAVKALVATFPVWAAWAAGSETISHISVWDNLTAGNYLYSFALNTPRAMLNGDTLTLTSHSFTLTPLAA